MTAALPLEVDVTARSPGDLDVDVVAVPTFKGGIEGPGAADALRAAGLDDMPVTAEFRGDIGQTLHLAGGEHGPRSVLLVGLGRMVDVDPARLRDAAASAVTAVPRAASMATTLAEVHATPASVHAVVEGLQLAAHRDRRYRHTPDDGALSRVAVVAPSSRLSECRRAAGRAAVTAQATLTARELTTTPPAFKTPPALAEQLSQAAGTCCTVEVWDEPRLEAEGCGGLLAVGGGAGNGPRMVRVRYRPASPLGRVALVGKGVTFDSGGLSLKHADEMPMMKADMAGAATVAAVCGQLEALDTRTSVDAWLPLAENLPSGGAYRPGDVVRHPDGTTTEVVDTDAEGRLLLADALALACAEQPDAVVDLATLTGAAVRAVGAYAAAAMSSDEHLWAALRAAAEFAGERIWLQPLWDELDRFLHSDVADHRQTGDGPHGDPGSDMIMAGLLLQRFVGEVPWAHLDAPACWLDEELAFGVLPAGATGFGARTLLAWLAPSM